MRTSPPPGARTATCSFLIERGAEVAHAPQAVVVHPIRPAPGISLRQQRKILFDALLYKKHPALYRKKIRSGPPWDYYCICGSLLTGLAAAASGFGAAAIGLASLWGLMTGRFFWSRVRDTPHRLKHLGEMAVTSALIPPGRVLAAVRGREVSGGVL
jgi:hypothetical protein